MNGTDDGPQVIALRVGAFLSDNALGASRGTVIAISPLQMA